MSRPRTLPGHAFNLVLYGSIVLLVVFLLAPLLITAVTSVGTSQYLEFPPRGFSLQWYERFLRDDTWISAIRTSLQVAVLSTLIVTVLGTFGAIGLSRCRFRGKPLVQAFVISPLIVPLIVIATAEFLLFRRLGMLGTIPAMALGHAVVGLPVMILIVSAAFSRFDVRLEQAAISLGATPLRASLRVTFPCISPAIAAGAIFTFLSSLDELMIPLFISTADTQTLSVRIWNSVVLQIEPTVAAVSTSLIVVAIALGAAAAVLQRLRV